jgi:uncharacterized protein with PIN domain
MIAVDTSALMAVLLDETEADACASAVEKAERLVMSAATLSEALIVADRRNIGAHETGGIRRSNPASRRRPALVPQVHR